jgi:hypothetical protein
MLVWGGLPPLFKMAAHRADASSFLDNRGYKGPLIRGVNPATLFEKAVRDRITDSYYWKEQCFGLNAATPCSHGYRGRSWHRHDELPFWE